MIQTVKSGNTNCYLIKMGSTYALIDAGTALDRDFLSKLQAIVSLNQIELVVLTHAHYDHVGHAAKLQKVYGSKIVIHQKDFDKAANGTMDFPKAKGLLSHCVRSFTMKEMERAKFIPFNADIIISSHKQLAQYFQIQLIELPGHTPGSIGVMFNGSLFAGDTVMNMPIPTKSWFADDFEILEKSIERINKLNIERIYPGHGTPFSAKWIRRI